MSNHRNLIIIGAGPSGLTAALYASRANMSPLLIEGEPTSASDMPGGQLMNTTEIENYPGAIGLQGPELISKMREQAVTFGTEILTKRVTKVELSQRPFKVWVGDHQYTADTVIVSTGAKPLMLGLDAEWKLMGRGVSACATCDGFFFRGKDIAVVGGGDTAMEEAIFLTNFASSVTVIHRRDTLRASKVMQDRAMANPKIKFQWNTQVVGIEGEKKLSGLELKDTVTGELSRREFDGLFIAIGHQPNSELFVDQLDTRPDGYLVTHGVLTSVPGVYACGDVQDSRYRQAVTSAGTGCMAALEALFLPVQDSTGPGLQVLFAMIGVGVVEEGLKFLPLAAFIYRKKYFNEHTDGVLYFAICGLAFGLVENILYTAQYGTATGAVRIVLTPFFHAATAGIVGFYLAKAKISGQTWFAPLGALGSLIIIHGVYNYGLSSRVLGLALVSLIISVALSAGLFVFYVRAGRLDREMALSANGKNNFCRSCGHPNAKRTLYCESCGQMT